jgi:hypothetical protein
VAAEHIAAWQGRLHFGAAQRRAYWGMGVDYPRLNEWPEWSTVEPGKVYAVEAGARLILRVTGR